MSQKQKPDLSNLTSKVLPCTCEHAFQDSQYGPGKRMHVPCTKDPLTARCTVCGTTRLRRGAAAFKSVVKKASCGAKKAGLKASGKQGRKGKQRQ